MMKSVLAVLMFSGSVFALSANAFAQTSPDTRQTDQSEEDWRKSKKKRGTSAEDIIDIIKNTRSSGVGNGRGYSPIDALPEESRRHLMKERAKRMAQAGPNEAVDVDFKPSEAAKSDADLENDEKAAWEEMAKGMNGMPATPSDPSQQGQSGQDASTQGQPAGGAQGTQGQPGGGQSSGQPGAPSGQSGSSPSVMRGGSAASVSDIMAGIKGMGQSAGNGSGQQGQTQSAQNQNGTSGSGSQSADAAQSGQQDGKAQTDSQSADAANNANAGAQSASEAQSSARVPEAISPLDRIKKVNREQNNSGSRSSASDYLRKK